MPVQDTGRSTAESEQGGTAANGHTVPVYMAVDDDVMFKEPVRHRPPPVPLRKVAPAHTAGFFNWSQMTTCLFAVFL